jgi:ATP-dependent protease ClpP protease subunit
MPFIELVAQRRPPTAPPGMQAPDNAKDWFRMEASPTEEDATDIYVYESIGGWFGMWADDFIQELKQVTSSNINLRINSPGGSVFDGIAIANAIRSHPANVTVYVDSIAASIASVIALAGDRVVMMPHSQFMVHNASGGCYGDATEMTKMADLLDKQSLNIAKAYAEHTGGALSDWQDYMAAETWFSAEEAVAVGLADEAMPMKKKQDAEPEPASAMARMQHTWDLSMYTYAGREKAPEPVIKPGLAAGLKNVAEAAGKVAETIRVGTPEFENYLREAIRAVIRDELSVVEGTACPTHSTAVKDGTWSASTNEGHLPSPVPVGTVKSMYAYYDETKVEDGAVPKSAAKLPHHFVSADGTPGAASINGVRNALARLPQTQGLSDAERKTAEAHLNAHLNAYSGDSEDHVHDDTTGTEPANAETPPDEDVEDASKKKLPPFLQPKKDDDEDGDADNAAEEEPDEDDEPGNQAVDPTTEGTAAVEPQASADPTETCDEDSAWRGLVDGLVAPSPSADDVFDTLRKEWS